ncbi:unnamed protein product, partial [Lepidochelys olivacea]
MGLWRISAPFGRCNGPLQTVGPDKVAGTEASQEGFDDVKRILSGKLVLCSPNWYKMFGVGVDASNTGLGVVLMQAGEEG